MSKTTLETVQQVFSDRRSIYALGSDLPVKPKEILDVIENVILHTPSAFNSQSSRIVVLFGEQHQQLWDITEAKVREAVGDGDFSASKQKIDGFRAAAGTVLFYEDHKVVESLQEQFALYADRFPIWAQQTSGMHQHAAWTKLRALGIGANLQHYNPLIDEEVAKAFSIEDSWELIAQMPFGNIVEPASEKTYQSIDERVKVLGLNS